MKKQIIAGMAAAMVCVGAVGGTFAYLTQTTETVNNTFTVGNNVQISLDEARVTELGVPAKKVGEEIVEVDDVDLADKVLGNIYKLMPNHEYVKNPTVHIDEDSEKCYVFIHVNNPISAIEALKDTEMENGSEYVQIAEQITNNGWTAITTDGYTGYYYKEQPIDGTAEDLDLEVFDNFMITKDAYIDKSEAAEKNEKNLNEYLNKQITITACAVQADGFTSATDAMKAWPKDFGPTTSVEGSTEAPIE